MSSKRLEKLGPRKKHSYTIWLTAWVSFRVAGSVISVHCSWLVAVPSGHSITNCNLTYTFESAAGRLCFETTAHKKVQKYQVRH